MGLGFGSLGFGFVIVNPKPSVEKSIPRAIYLCCMFGFRVQEDDFEGPFI